MVSNNLDENYFYHKLKSVYEKNFTKEIGFFDFLKKYGKTTSDGELYGIHQNNLDSDLEILEQNNFIASKKRNVGEDGIFF